MNRLTFNLALLIWILMLCGACKKTSIEINNTADLEVYLTEEMEDQKIPALSILLFEEQTVLYEKYLGQSHIENNVALESDHLFLLASISKVITATALLQLYEAGEFSLDDPINDYLSFDVSIPDFSQAITFRMLLTHTAGIADGSALDNEYYYGEDSPTALGDFLENYLSPSGNLYDEVDHFYSFAPGSEHEYSNVGNALIALLVEQIAEIDFNTYCKQNIFSPLGMNDSFWRLDEITQTIVQPYEYKSRSYNALPHYTFTDYPNGGLRSTARDLFILLGAFTQEGMANGYQLLQATTIAEMITPQIPSIDNEVGLHLFIMNRTHNLWGHDGGEQGVATIMAFNPSTKVGAIILTNQGEANLDEMLEVSYLLGLKL